MVVATEIGFFCHTNCLARCIVWVVLNAGAECILTNKERYRLLVAVHWGTEAIVADAVVRQGVLAGLSTKQLERAGQVLLVRRTTYRIARVLGGCDRSTGTRTNIALSATPER